MFQDGKLYSDMFRSDANSSILLLEGKRKELGTYTCRQTNRLSPLRSERIFIVSFDDVRRNTIVIAFSVAIVVLFVFGAAIGVKLYAYRVSDNEKDISFPV